MPLLGGSHCPHLVEEQRGIEPHGLGVRDLVPNLNFFSKVETSSSGEISYVPNHDRTGDFIDLRAETSGDALRGADHLLAELLEFRLHAFERFGGLLARPGYFGELATDLAE